MPGVGAAAATAKDLRKGLSRKKQGGGGRVVQLGGTEGGVSKPAMTQEEEEV